MGVLQGIVFSAAILFTKKYFSKTNSYLAYTVLSLSFSNLQYWFLDSDTTTLFPVLGILRIPCDFLMIPMFYIFVNQYLEKEISKRQKLLLYLPFAIDLLLQITNTINKEVYNEKLISHDIVYNYLVFEETFSMCFSALLIILTIRLVHEYEKENIMYNIKVVKARTKWLKQILFIGLTVCCFWVIQIYFMLNKNNGMSIYYPLWICISFIIYWLSYVGLFQSSLLSQRKTIRREILNRTAQTPLLSINSDIGPKDAKDLSNDKIFTEFGKIIEQSYLNPNLSLEDVANELKISSNYLSQIISNKNIRFNDYLNSIRIDRVKLMLKDEEFCGYTITSIGLEAGFNSNASFYRAFKKQTNMSPSDYRDQ